MLPLDMLKDKIIKTRQGNLVVWLLEEKGKTVIEKKYASRIFDKIKNLNVFKVHANELTLDAYVHFLNAGAVK